MARFDDKNGGRISGLIGNVVIADDIIRRRPRPRKKSSWTEDQKAQRTRYSALISLYRNLKNSIVNPIWTLDTPKGVTGYNLFLKENVHAFNTNGELQDPLKLKMAIGKLPQPFNINAHIDSADPIKVEITWKNDPAEDGHRYNDSLIAVFFNGEDFTEPISTEYSRKDEAATIELPERYEAGSYLYLFFGNEKKDAFCESWVGLL